MIEDIGKVVQVIDDKAYVEVERSSACAQCGLQEAEELATGGKVVFEAYNLAGAKSGDRVKVQVRTGAYMRALLYIYGIPVLFLIIGAIAGAYAATILRKSSDTISALFAMGGLVVGFIILFLLRKRSNKAEYMPVVVEVMQDNVASGN
ncbi:MAG: SoxR reducing system RseC family protein [Nitrospirota bacterium]|nr:SoxR reducing system RseC family protein [Nitrospirota bacterium]